MADEKISRFFKDLGFKLRNDRKSWGAINGDAVLLRTWSDELKASPRSVCVLKQKDGPGGTSAFGQSERRDHVLAIWEGDIPAYTVIVNPKATKDGDRAIGDFRSDVVFPITGVYVDGSAVYATYSAPIPVSALAEHMTSHLVPSNQAQAPQILLVGRAEVPDSPADRTGQLAGKVREYLVHAATRDVTITYAELFDEFDLNRMTVRKVLGNVGHQCLDQGEPILTALVVYKGGVSAGRCGPGFKAEFKVDEDEERDRVFAHWRVDDSEVGSSKGRDWTDAELSDTVDCYREMLQLAAAGQPFVKAAYYRKLGQKFDRVPGAFERRMQNISHLLAERDLRWLSGLKPQENIGLNVEPRLFSFLMPLIDELSVGPGYADELVEPTTVIEGAKKQVTVNAYERDASAKPRCIAAWGCVCVICSFDFAAAYGELGEGFIHVHHLKPIHTIGEAYELDPENDLRPVCPNCHSMLHRRKIVLSIEELTARLRWRFEALTQDGQQLSRTAQD